MHIVIAADSFKGSNTSLEVGKAIERGMGRIFPQASFEIIPVADGGEGTVAAVLQAVSGSLQKLELRDPLGRPAEGFWGLLPNGKAVLEMAAASGLTMLSEAERNPFITTTYGTGELIRAALDAKVSQIMIGLGGSATNDGGVGMAQALGARFLDASGHELEGTEAILKNLASIDLSAMDARLKQTEILIACDVSNPLLGEQGASAVYGPQKGAKPEDVKVLDARLAHLSKLTAKTLGRDFSREPGAGAAGGLGFGLLSFCGATLLPGIETILRIIEFDTIAARADLVITGEGRLDGQSVFGKVPIGVAQWAKKASKPVVAIVGELGEGAHQVFEHGIDALFPTVDRVMSLDAALAESNQALEATAERMARALQLGQSL